ncbi:hypothetical protein MKC74_14475 [[Clostridium] innocuum]|nr:MULTISPECIES: hypothetical protein [Bacillota]MBV4071320.1 hypothetical protein [[Clostridium] innocuum]MCH1946630.1 hypothetical protein [[Clostridium] innocuum]MCH1947513.1 hypothetical protein [[Clostridium] innocuum]MCH1957511.1 hypothetical protein [[Clostridium] innocuum]MCH1958393.1 hypothetical protein [[Clostridium] innocuum]
MPRLSSKTKVHMRIKPTLVERQSEGHLWWSQRKTAISAALCISARKDDWQERNRCAARMYQHKRTKTVSDNEHSFLLCY